MRMSKTDENVGDFSSVGTSGKKLNFTAVLLGVLVLLFVASAVSSFYFKKQLSDLKANPQKIGQEEVNSVLSKVSKIMLLPEGEVPTLATVADLSKLKDQPFFDKAKVGDKVLLYTQARKAILYSPTENKIVEVAPINIGNPAANQ